ACGLPRSLPCWGSALPPRPWAWCCPLRRAESLLDHDLACQRPLYGAAFGDLRQALPLLGAQIAVQRQLLGDVIQHSVLGLAVAAVLGVDVIVLQSHLDTREGPAFSL